MPKFLFITLYNSAHNSPRNGMITALFCSCPTTYIPGNLHLPVSTQLFALNTSATSLIVKKALESISCTRLFIRKIWNLFIAKCIIVFSACVALYIAIPQELHITKTKFCISASRQKKHLKGWWYTPLAMIYTSASWWYTKPVGLDKKISFRRTRFFGSPCWARTSDIMINSHALYRLS